MRRSPLILAVAAALVPVTMLATASSVAAASGSLTVTTLGRTGAKVATTVTVFNVGDGSEYKVKAGKVRSLPKGTYAVLADIANPRDGSNTLGAQVVKVSGRTKTTIDARQGRPLTISLPGGPGRDHQSLHARICTTSSSSSAAVETWNSPGKTFVIPNGSKRLQFAYLSTWSGVTRDAFAVAATTTGVPRTALTRTFRGSSLATVKVYARRGPAGSPDTTLIIESAGKGCQNGLQMGIAGNPAPLAVNARVSAGKWTVQAMTSAEERGGQYPYIAHWYTTGTYAARRTYSTTFFMSAWGPARSLPHVIGDHLIFNTANMFVDPGASDWGSEGSSKSTVALSLKGKVLKKQVRTDWGAHDTAFFEYRLKKAGWYTLGVNSRRYRPGITYPKDMLSTGSSATFRFYAKPNVAAVAPVFLARMQPAGLDMLNRAKPRSTTTVDLKLDRRSQSPDSKLGKATVKTVTAKASFDGGRTWKVIRVKRVGARWTAVVPNPAAGVVALRAKVADAKGNSAEVTVLRAYTIG